MLRLFRVSLTVTVLFIVALWTSPAAAEIPNLLAWQGVALDSLDAPLADGDYNIHFAIYNDPTAGDSLWGESHLVTIQNGVINVLLGTVVPVPDSVFAGPSTFLQVQFESEDPYVPRSQILSVGYAFRVGTIDGATGGSISGPLTVDDEIHSTSGGIRFPDNSVQTTAATGGGGGGGWVDDGTVVRLETDTDNVGIGLDDPSEKLDVVGNIHASGTLISGNSITIDGTNDRITASSGTLELNAGHLVATGKTSIGVGHTNTGNLSSICGGAFCSISGDWATISGGNGNSAVSIYTTVSGGAVNLAGGNAATVAGGFQDTASANYSTVGGGISNIASQTGATVGGGGIGRASGQYSTVAGGFTNLASADGATVGGGGQGIASGEYATVAGGFTNVATFDAATASGGHNNFANGPSSTVGGGGFNIAQGSYSVVGGGGGPTVSDTNSATGDYSTISGGRSNTASGAGATVGGGQDNSAIFTRATVSGGGFNTAGAFNSTVGGGVSNTASGSAATVPGGLFNTASGLYSFAAGRQAKAIHDGAFVWADNLGADIASVAKDQFVVRAVGGVWFGATSSPTATAGRFIETSTGGYLTDGGSWTNSSDKNLKENFVPVNGQELLEKISTLSISQWNYKAESDAVKHIGPTAQDFFEHFSLGDDDKAISTIDPAGIALAAIQELYRKTKEIDELRAELEELRSMIERAFNEDAEAPRSHALLSSSAVASPTNAHRER